MRKVPVGSSAYHLSIILLLGALCACSANPNRREAWDTSMVTEHTSIVVPYVIDGKPENWGQFNHLVPPVGGGLAGVAIYSFVQAGIAMAESADKSDIGRHVSVFEINGRTNINAKKKIVLSAGRHRLGVKHCHEGSLQPPCSLLVEIAFTAKGGSSYELVLLDGGAVMLKELGSGLPAGWGDGLAVTSEDYLICLLSNDHAKRTERSSPGDESIDVHDASVKAETFCREAHPASYQASIKG